MAIRHIDVNTNRAFKASAPNQEVISEQTRIIYDEPQPDAFVKERKMDGTTKTAIGIGAVVLAGLGILTYVKKGKGKAAEPVKEALKQITDQSKKIIPAQEPQKVVLSIADFKKVGVFKDGKALIDGKGFTGTIEICKEKGTRKIYEDGILRKAFRKGNERIYSYDKNGKVSKIIEDVVGDKDIDTKVFKVFPDGRKSIGLKWASPVIEKTKNLEIKYRATAKVLSKDGTVKNYKIGRATVIGDNANTNGRIYEIVTDMQTGKFANVRKIYGSPADKKLVSHVGNPLDYTRKHEIVDGKKVTKFYDNAGELSHITQSSYDPKTGIFVKAKDDILGEAKIVKVTDRNSKAEFSVIKDKTGAVKKVTKKTSGGESMIQGSNLDKKALIGDLFPSDANSDFGKACIDTIMKK